MRVYVPATLAALGELQRFGRLAVDGDVGYAVTPALREGYADGDTEELEYAALSMAARASLSLLAAEPGTPRRRVVVAADVARAVPDGAHGVASVRLGGPISLGAVTAVHVDDAEAEPTVAAAVQALDAAERDADAMLAVDKTDGFELLWYATQEIPDLLHA